MKVKKVESPSHFWLHARTQKEKKKGNLLTRKPKYFHASGKFSHKKQKPHSISPSLSPPWVN
jgi:hypothetical protein